jgi:thiol:disulfide interchange protein
MLPLVPAFTGTIPLTSALALITGTFVIEYGAAALGIGLGLPPLYILYVLVCVALGVTLTMFGIFDVLGVYSKKVSRFLKKSEERAGRSLFLKKYGMYGLVPCVITLGFYACPPVSWVLGWPRNRSILLIMAGYITISIVTLLVTMGFFSIIHL